MPGMCRYSWGCRRGRRFGGESSGNARRVTKKRFAMGLFLGKCFYQELELPQLNFLLLFALFTPLNSLTVGLVTSVKKITFSFSFFFLTALALEIKPFATQIYSFHIHLTKLRRKLFHIFVSVTMICLSQFSNFLVGYFHHLLVLTTNSSRVDKQV